MDQETLINIEEGGYTKHFLNVIVRKGFDIISNIINWFVKGGKIDRIFYLYSKPIFLTYMSGIITNARILKLYFCHNVLCNCVLLMILYLFSIQY